MQTYNVTIDFKKGSSFSMPVEAWTERMAISIALTVARGCGFDAPVKKSLAVEAKEPA